MKYRIKWECDICRHSGHADVELPMARLWVEDAIERSHKRARGPVACAHGLQITKIGPVPAEAGERARCPVCNHPDIMEGQGKRPVFLCGADPDGSRCAEAARVVRELRAAQTDESVLTKLY